MTGVGHLIIGGFATFAVLSKLEISETQLYGGLAVGLLASVLPDIDAPNSILQVFVIKSRPVFADNLISWRDRKSIFGGLFYSILAAIELLIRVVLKTFFDLIKTFTSHRKFTHYLIGMLFFGSLVYIVTALSGFSLIYSLAFFIGYITHLLGDLTTVSGLRILSPFSEKVFYILPSQLRITSSKSITLKEVLYILFFVAISLIVFGGKR